MLQKLFLLKKERKLNKMAEGGYISKKAYGYDVKLVDESVTNDNTCSICLMILREPKQAEQCGHRFCEKCIAEYHENK